MKTKGKKWVEMDTVIRRIEQLEKLVQGLIVWTNYEEIDQSLIFPQQQQNQGTSNHSIN